MFICEMWLYDLFFSTILQIWYEEVQMSQSISESPLDWDDGRRFVCAAMWENLPLDMCIQGQEDQPKHLSGFVHVCANYSSETYYSQPLF